MSASDLTVVAAIARDIAGRLAGVVDTFTERQSDGIRTLLKGMLLACPRNKEIRPQVVAFAQALAAHLATADDKIAPIRPSVAAARNAAILDHAVALVKAIERQAAEQLL